MANIIKIKRSETSDSIPTISDLEVGEICMNIADQKLYTRKSDDTIVIVSDANSGTPELELISTDTSAAAGPVLDLYRNSFSPFDSDAIGEIKFQGENDNSDKVVFAKITSKIADATASSEDAIIEFHVQENGSSEAVIQIKGDGIHIMSGKKITFADGTSMSTAATSSSSGASSEELNRVKTLAIALG
jgi:hypothetical protein